ncbi:MAG: hypothetical protein PHC64_11250 [Candidatus Gastranaerophilales bacterium]|nr:hypothetical protein [Candidatus Gastranaerophilales bacterium]
MRINSQYQSNISFKSVIKVSPWVDGNPVTGRTQGGKISRALRIALQENTELRAKFHSFVPDFMMPEKGKHMWDTSLRSTIRGFLYLFTGEHAHQLNEFGQFDKPGYRNVISQYVKNPDICINIFAKKGVNGKLKIEDIEFKTPPVTPVTVKTPPSPPASAARSKSSSTNSADWPAVAPGQNQPQLTLTF